MIDFDTLFSRIGKCFYIGELVLADTGTTIPTAVEAFLTEMQTADPLFQDAVVDGIDTSLSSYKATSSSTISSFVTVPVQRLIVQTVTEDTNLLSSYGLSSCTTELIKQMIAAGESVEESTISVSVSYGDGGSSSGPSGDNVGDGILLFSTKRPDGLVNQFVLAETLTANITTAATTGTATWTITGELSKGTTSVDYPAGSGINKTVSSYIASTGSSLVDGTFETEDANADNLPSGWTPVTATLGTTLKLTPVEEQTITINGSPDGGFYWLKFTDKAGITYTTIALPYNATADQVQYALRLLPNLSSITVSSTGTTPNYTHTVVFYDTPNPAQLTSTNSLTGGTTPTITHATPVAGSAYVARGARCLQLIGDGAQLTTIQIPVNVSALTQYGICIWAATDSAPASGVVVIDLVDGLAGTVLEDDQGTANTLSINTTTLTATHSSHAAMFRTPTVLPSKVYLRIRLSTAIENAHNVFLDELCFVPATELYAGGLWCAAFSGPTNFTVNDNASITVANDYAGQVHLWLNRVLGLSTKRVLFPVSNSPTQPDSIIS